MRDGDLTDFADMIKEYQQFLVARREWHPDTSYVRTIELSTAPSFSLPALVQMNVIGASGGSQSLSVRLVWPAQAAS